MTTKTPAKEPGIRGWVLLLALGLSAAVAGLIGAIVMSASGTDETTTPADPTADDEGADDDVFDFSALPRDRSGNVGAGATGAPAANGTSSPVPERVRSRIQLGALGSRPPQITVEQLMATLQENRAPLRECVRQAGGFRALRAEAPADRQRLRPQMRFDIGPDGRVVPGSVSLEPAGPEGLSSCISDALVATQFTAAGGDGAHVELPLGIGRGGGRRGSPDGGVGGDGAGRPPRGDRPVRGDGTGRAAGTATVPAVAPP